MKLYQFQRVDGTFIKVGVLISVFKKGRGVIFPIDGKKNDLACTVPGVADMRPVGKSACALKRVVDEWTSLPTRVLRQRWEEMMDKFEPFGERMEAS